MKKFIFGFFNRKTLCYEDFVIFDDFKSLVDYEKALFSLSSSGKYVDFEFPNYIIYPKDYSLYLLCELDLNCKQPFDSCNLAFNKCFGDFCDVLGIKKASDEDVKRDSDDYDSEPVYASKSPRS